MQFKKRILSSIAATLVVTAGGLTLSGNVYANDSDELESLRALVQQLDQKVKVLERKGEIATEDGLRAPDHG